MTKSELIGRLARGREDLTTKDMELAVNTLLKHIAETLESGQRVEIRGFGSFSLRYRAARTGRDPKTGNAVELDAKHKPHFKAGKALRDRVNDAALRSLRLTRRVSRLG